MPTTILRFGMLLILAALGVPAAAQPELFFAAGVDSTGWAQAQSNADGHVLIESPQYPHGLWLHWVDDAGDALAGLQVEYQEQPDSLVAIRCVDLVGAMRETLIWTRPEGDALRLTIKPKEAGDLPAGLASIDWQIDPSVESLLEPVEDIRLIGWEAVAAFLRERWQNQVGRVAMQFNARTLAIEVDHPEDVETLLAHLQQAQQPTYAALGAISPLKMQMQIFAGNLGLQEGVILDVSLFDDSNLERVVRKALGRPRGPFTPEDFASLVRLWAHRKSIRSLAGIEYFAALIMLELPSNQITDLTPISQLNSLEGLYLRYNQITDLTPISQLKNLQGLGMGGNQITDLTPISQLNSLITLWMNDNEIDDLTPISQLKNLDWLDFDDNRIVDLTPISQLKNLKWLSLGLNRIVDLTPISQLKNLQSLHLNDNEIDDLTPISQLKNLKWLFLGGNQITDLTPLSQLNSLEGLYLRYNQITDLTPISQLNSLKWLFLGGNQITDLTPLNQLKNLEWLYLYENPLSDQVRTEQIPALKARGVDVRY